MQREILIESTQNERFKRLFKLVDNNRFRRQQGVIVVEGLKEIVMALQAGLVLEEIYFHRDSSESIRNQIGVKSHVFVLSPGLFDKVTYRESTSQALAVFKSSSRQLSDLTLSDCPLIIILEELEKPGNLGAILRTADAAGVDAVLLDSTSIDCGHPNVIRSSVGTVFSVPVVQASDEEILAFCKKNQIKIYAAALQDAVPYTEVDLNVPAAIVMGAEDKGLRPFWREHASNRIFIPMLGVNDSLNVSVATGVLAYEAVRQRLPTV